MANIGWKDFCRPQPFSGDGFPHTLYFLKEMRPDIAQRLAGLPLLNIGCGPASAEQSCANFVLDELKALRVTGVDPYHLRTAELAPNHRTVRQDGLSFLLEQPGESANIFTHGLDCCIFNEDFAGDYLDDFVKQIYRVQSKNGVYVCSLSDVLDERASRIFPRYEKIGWLELYVFYR